MNEITVQKVAGVHEKTVQKAEELANQHAPKRRRGKAKNKNTRVRVLKVDPRVMETAKKLAKGDLTRLKIIDPITVVVENPKVK